jgi:hypothetical protein
MPTSPRLAPSSPRLPCRSTYGRDHQARDTAHLAPQLPDPPARSSGCNVRPNPFRVPLKGIETCRRSRAHANHSVTVRSPYVASVASLKKVPVWRVTVPDSGRNFPVIVRREFGYQVFDFAAVRTHGACLESLRFDIFPVFFPVSRESDAETGSLVTVSSAKLAVPHAPVASRIMSSGSIEGRPISLVPACREVQPVSASRSD